MAQDRVTPDNIRKLLQDEVFVFGSNESGLHGGGAARIAHDRFGAVTGVGWGKMGHSFALPTKDWILFRLSTVHIGFYVERFIDYAKIHKHEKFLVTKIGCGLAGYSPEDIAPLFKGAINVRNIYLPQEFWEILKSCK